MIAVDTNVIVRVIAGDDPQQAGVAADAVAGGVFVSSGVLIETEWVLRSVFKWPRDRIVAGVQRLLREHGVVTDHGHGLAWAVERYAGGADWTDMIHLLDAVEHSEFLTFDRRIPKDAGPEAPVTVRLLR